MPKIKFTADPKLPADMKHLGYKAGLEIDLPQDQAERWMRRGVAIYAAVGQSEALRDKARDRRALTSDERAMIDGKDAPERSGEPAATDTEKPIAEQPAEAEADEAKPSTANWRGRGRK